MSSDSTEPDPTVIRTKTVRIPPVTSEIRMKPAFGGGYVITFGHPVNGQIGSEVAAPAGVTFNPDGTLTIPLPYDFPED